MYAVQKEGEKKKKKKKDYPKLIAGSHVTYYNTNDQ